MTPEEINQSDNQAPELFAKSYGEIRTLHVFSRQAHYENNEWTVIDTISKPTRWQRFTTWLKSILSPK